MTAYRILDEEQKYEKKAEIFLLLNTCFEEEVNFWLNQFEANRPTDAALTRAQNAYIDSYNKMKSAIEELGFEELEESYLTDFDNYFIKNAMKYAFLLGKPLLDITITESFFQLTVLNG